MRLQHLVASVCPSCVTCNCCPSSDTLCKLLLTSRSYGCALQIAIALCPHCSPRRHRYDHCPHCSPHCHRYDHPHGPIRPLPLPSCAVLSPVIILSDPSVVALTLPPTMLTISPAGLDIRVHAARQLLAADVGLGGQQHLGVGLGEVEDGRDLGHDGRVFVCVCGCERGGKEYRVNALGNGLDCMLRPPSRRSRLYLSLSLACACSP